MTDGRKRSGGGTERHRAPARGKRPGGEPGPAGRGVSPLGDPDFQLLGDLLGDVEVLHSVEVGPVRGSGVGACAPADPGRRIAALWEDTVGAEIAENAVPLQFKQGRLVVAASSSAWAQTLQLMGEDIRKRMNDALGGDAVTAVTFRHAGWENRGRALQPSPSRPVEHRGGEPMTEAQRAAVAEVEALDIAPALRDRIIHAMQASFVRDQQD
jgi:hypothetical protein